TGATSPPRCAPRRATPWPLPPRPMRSPWCPTARVSPPATPSPSCCSTDTPPSLASAHSVPTRDTGGARSRLTLGPARPKVREERAPGLTPGTRLPARPRTDRAAPTCARPVGPDDSARLHGAAPGDVGLLASGNPCHEA